MTNLWLRVLPWVVGLNYLAQIPYYFHQYYFRGRVSPNWWGVGLLGLTAIWFVVGFARYKKLKTDGAFVLGSFLVTQALFYLHSAVFSFWSKGMLAQLANPSWFLKVIFGIGYLNGLVAAICLYFLWQNRADG
jgi:hypothetical protein